MQDNIETTFEFAERLVKELKLPIAVGIGGIPNPSYVVIGPFHIYPGRYSWSTYERDRRVIENLVDTPSDGMAAVKTAIQSCFIRILRVHANDLATAMRWEKDQAQVTGSSAQF